MKPSSSHSGSAARKKRKKETPRSQKTGAAAGAGQRIVKGDVRWRQEKEAGGVRRMEGVKRERAQDQGEGEEEEEEEAEEWRG